MKLRYFIASIVALAGVAAGCVQQLPGDLAELQVSSSYVSLPAEGGSASISVTATAPWSFGEVPSWLTVTPTSGSGSGNISFSASEAKSTQEAVLKIKVGEKFQYINVKQAVGKQEVALATCAEVIAGPDNKTYRIEGVVSAIEANVYGNYNVTDATGTVYIYGTLDKSGATKNFSSWGLENGDIICCEGPKTTYNGKVELVDVTVISITKSLIKVEEAPEQIDIEGGIAQFKLTCKGDGVFVEIPEADKSWLSVSSIKLAGTTAIVSIQVAPNAEGTRETTLSFVTEKDGQTYTAEATLSQLGAIAEVSCAAFNAKEDGAAVYKVSGIVTRIVQDSEKYGTNFYFKDASGEEVYVYGTVDADGKVIPLEAKAGLSVGDIVTMVGSKTSYKNSPQMAKGFMESKKDVTVATAEEVGQMEDEKDTKNPQNYIMLTGIVADGSSISGHKFDLETYGNFELVDATGAAYIYGVSTGWNGETKKFGTLGVKEGDTITIVGYKTSYKGTNEVVGMYVSHTPAE
ncbi:MAG: BACON domain-containing protein [Bacteroidales bacterium]|nr:BACON domain-containing protein [Bacteroidales bacterium]